MNNLGYLKGVIVGDGYIVRSRSNRNPRVGLEVIDEVFSERFLNHLRRIGLQPSKHERTRRHKHYDHPRFKKYDFTTKYYVVRATCSKKLAEELTESPKPEEELDFVIGFYDSEGSHGVYKYGTRTLHRLWLYNSNISLLREIQRILSKHEVDLALRTPNSNFPYLETQDRERISQFFKLIGRLPKN